MNTTRCHTLTRLLLSCLLMVLLTVTVSAAETVSSGTCGAEGDGSNLTWTLDSDGVLTISGSGRMMDYSYYGCAPWYENRESVRMVNIGEGVTYIGDFAFYGCSSLTRITIPDSVTSIGSGAFESCSSLPSVTIPDSVTSIGSSVFIGCTSLTSVTIPDSVTSIGDNVFKGCSSLTSVTIPNSVTSIGDSVFKGCSSLPSVTIPDSVTSIGSTVFSGCTSLTSVTIPDSVTSIGGSAFYGCSSLTSITIGSGVTSIGGRTFDRCSSLTNVYISDMDAWCRIAFGNYDATPMCYAKNIYLNGNKIVSVEVPQDVTSLQYTFCGFRDLIRVTIPGSVTSVGRYAFSSCTSLTSVTIPDSVTSIGYHAFYGCGSVSSIAIPNGVTSIGYETFCACSNLTSIMIPDSVTSIGDGAFYDCEKLKSVTVGKGVASIGRWAFLGCDKLTDVHITDMDAWLRIDFRDKSSSPANHAGNIYLNGEKIESVEVPQGVTEIKNYTFYGFSGLNSVSLPSSITRIGYGAFDNCRSPMVVYITDVAAWCRINFDNEKANPLYYAKNLYVNGAKAETLEIPEGVQVISSNAFINAACIGRVALPKSLTGVAANAFSGCKNIERIYYAGSESEWNALPISAGNDSLKNAQIYYNSTLDDYYCRIRVKVSDGGRIYVDRSTAEEGNTVTVTAAPYEGYELDAIYVDGAKIEGNTFVVTGNHEVSAVFTKLPVYGGTQDYRLEGIAVQTMAGERLQELAREKLLVSVSIRHTQGTDGAAVMLAQYDAEGRYQGLVWLTLDEMPLNMALKVTLPVDNSDGKIANLKAFVVGSILSPAPVGSAVSFGDV